MSGETIMKVFLCTLKIVKRVCENDVQGIIDDLGS